MMTIHDNVTDKMNQGNVSLYAMNIHAELNNKPSLVSVYTINIEYT